MPDLDNNCVLRAIFQSSCPLITEPHDFGETLRSQFKKTLPLPEVLLVPRP